LHDSLGPQEKGGGSCQKERKFRVENYAAHNKPNPKKKPHKTQQKNQKKKKKKKKKKRPQHHPATATGMLISML